MAIMFLRALMRSDHQRWAPSWWGGQDLTAVARMLPIGWHSTPWDELQAEISMVKMTAHPPFLDQRADATSGAR